MVFFLDFELVAFPTLSDVVSTLSIKNSSTTSEEFNCMKVFHLRNEKSTNLATQSDAVRKFDGEFTKIIQTGQSLISLEILTCESEFQHQLHNVGSLEPRITT
jgi:hypothetical protein